MIMAFFCSNVDCGDPTPVGGTLVSGNDFTYTHSATVECSIGYNILGSPTITCQSDGTWTAIPTCIPLGKIFELSSWKIRWIIFIASHEKGKHPQGHILLDTVCPKYLEHVFDLFARHKCEYDRRYT